MEYADIDRIYRTLPLDRIPWYSETPPGALVDLVQKGIVRPCPTVDLGCGAGTYACHLASLGFEVTGIDSSPRAIEMAEERARERGSACRFVVADLLGDLQGVAGGFDFAYDWELLHHIYPEDRERYVRNVHAVTNPGARYLSVSFSEDDPQFGGSGKFRTTTIGTTLYFSSVDEIRDLVAPFFAVRTLKTIEIDGRYGPHRAVYLLAERR